jgi:hypothetical protein
MLPVGRPAAAREAAGGGARHRQASRGPLALRRRITNGRRSLAGAPVTGARTGVVWCRIGVEEHGTELLPVGRCPDRLACAEIQAQEKERPYVWKFWFQLDTVVLTRYTIGKTWSFANSQKKFDHDT